MEEKTLLQLCREAADQLKKARVPDPRYDARVLLMSAFQLGSAQYLLYETMPPSALVPRILPDAAALAAASRRFSEYIGRRCRREPLQQILGSVGFYGLDFLVTRDVLCPRADTETLVDAVLENVENSGALLDLCTGSGCIAISLAKSGHFREVTAVDISEAALHVAKENAYRLLQSGVGTEVCREEKKCGLPKHADWEEAAPQGGVYAELAAPGLRFTLLRSDMFSALAAQQNADGSMKKYNCIVSNPPYIPSAVVEELEPEVRDYEPRIALDGDADGLAFYRILAAESPRYLLPGGRLFLEIGYDQGESVPALLRAAGFREVEVLRDLCGQNRVVTGHL